MNRLDDIKKCIWFEADQQDHVFKCARRVFYLEDKPEHARLLITCSGLYRLWVNGRFAARGPALSGLKMKRYDILDIAEFLKKGDNLIAVQLIHFYQDTAQGPAGQPAFWCQLDCGGFQLSSDERWRMSVDPAYFPTTIFRAAGVQEVYDSRQAQNWKKINFDDSDWAYAKYCCKQTASREKEGIPWERLIPRGIPQCREEKMIPEKIIRIGEVLPQEFTPWLWKGRSIQSLAVNLLKEIPEEPRLTSIVNPEALLKLSEDAAVVNQTSYLDYSQFEQRDATIILDFGREVTGFFWLDVEGNDGAIVDIAYSELLISGRVQSVVHQIHYADRYILKEGRQWHEIHDWKGFRYVQLTFRRLTVPLMIHGVGVTFTSYPVEQKACFTCSDQKLTDIWRIGAYTQLLCMQDKYIDCPWREQQEWLGDGYITAQNVFGETLLRKKFIEDFAYSQSDNGWMPCRPYSESACNDQPLTWIFTIEYSLLYDRDIPFVQRLLPQIEKLLNWYHQYTNCDGLLENVPGIIHIDWSKLGKDGMVATLNALYYMALCTAIRISKAVGKSDIQRQDWEIRARKLKDAYHRVFWNEEQQLYVDNLMQGKQTGIFSQQTQAAAVMSGLCNVDAKTLLIKAMESDSLVQTEAYFSYYFLEALACAGLYKEALTYIRKRWGDMIKAGATSFWEVWNLYGYFHFGYWHAAIASSCHSYSSGPTIWLSRYVLGVRVEMLNGPIVIQPHPCDLTHASGKISTCYGLVDVDWTIENETMRVKVEVPAGVKVQINEPQEYAGRFISNVQERENEQ